MTNAGRIQSNGIDIQTSNNSWPFVCDWNQDGRKDLLVGQEGIGQPCNVFVYLNQGTNAAPVFNDSVPVLHGGNLFRDYRCIPLTLDLDGDGLKDLILGEWYSSVRLYPNQGTNAEPVFSTFDNLVPADPDSFRNGNPPRVNFADWDGDQDLDMITCDYYGSVFLRRNITPAAIAEPEVLRPVLQRLTITPSPVTGKAVLSLRVNRPGVLDVGVFTLSGERIATPFQGMSNAGDIRLSWDVSAGDNLRLPNGLYLVRARAGNEILTGKLLLVR